MDFSEYLSHNDELYASPSDPYWPPFEASTEIEPHIGLGAWVDITLRASYLLTIIFQNGSGSSVAEDLVKW